jgi:hypothetical protein
VFISIPLSNPIPVADKDLIPYRPSYIPTPERFCSFVTAADRTYLDYVFVEKKSCGKTQVWVIRSPYARNEQERGRERERERERDGGSERKKERKKERNEERNEQNTTPAMFLLEELQLLYIPHACTVHITYDICTIE